jgi:hypothetical protein
MEDPELICQSAKDSARTKRDLHSQARSAGELAAHVFGKPVLHLAYSTCPTIAQGFAHTVLVFALPFSVGRSGHDQIKMRRERRRRLDQFV